MSNDNTILHIDTLYTVAEDINRFSPWEDGIAPFVLIDPEHPEAYVLVVIEDDGEGICFNVYCYNVQPGVEIDYASGESQAA